MFLYFVMVIVIFQILTGVEKKYKLQERSSIILRDYDRQEIKKKTPKIEEAR